MLILPDCAQLFLHEGGNIEVIIIISHDTIILNQGSPLDLFAQIIGYGIRYNIIRVYDIQIQAIRQSIVFRPASGLGINLQIGRLDRNPLA